MKIGQKVMLIAVDDFMPPIGAIGFIASTLDEDGDYLVDFPDHPCPALGEGGVFEPEWYIPDPWLLPIDDDALAFTTERELCAA